MTLDNVPIVKIVVPNTNIPENIAIDDCNDHPQVVKLIPFPGTGQGGAQGTTGPQGIQGPIGIQGTSGQNGQNGQNGTQGLIGLQGVSGQSGLQGNVGIQGYQGNTGAQGLSGAQGTSGLQGMIGNQGITGPQGQIGLQGITGPQGTTGSQGITGSQGFSGIQGFQGLQGIIGLQGLVGIEGSQGLIGLQGTVGSQGLTGSQGLSGTQGLIGQGVASGGTEGQILAKIDATDYNTTWIDNYTSQIKHLVKAGVSINRGQAVYVTGSTGTSGTNMIVGLASNNSETTSSKTLGLITQNLNINDIGFVITEGLIDGLDTSSAVAGDPVWLGTNGNLIYGLTNKPYAPNHLVFIGIVTRVQQNNGEIFVKVQNGFELEELHNLVISNLQNGDAIVYDSSTGKWKNSAISGGSGSQGAQGIVGSQGIQGLQGLQGTSGTLGAQGDQGISGAQGTTGLQGFVGLQGLQGTQGLQGSQGIQGLQGLLGLQGSIGLGLLSGGTTNQVLAKVDGTNYNVYWMDSQALGTTSSPTFNNLTVNGIFYPQQINESFQTYATSITSGSTVTLDCSAGNIWNITSSVAGNWTANLTNINLTSGFATNITLIINQGSTAYIPNAIQISGAAQAINWQGGIAPTPNANKKDAIAISILNNSGTYTVFGQLVTFG